MFLTGIVQGPSIAPIFSTALDVSMYIIVRTFYCGPGHGTAVFFGVFTWVNVTELRLFGYITSQVINLCTSIFYVIVFVKFFPIFTSQTRDGGGAAETVEDGGGFGGCFQGGDGEPGEDEEYAGGGAGA